MTKPITKWVLILFLFLFAGCFGKEKQDTVDPYQTTQIIIPGTTLRADNSNSEADVDELNKSLQSFNIISDDYRILTSYSIDIDSNEDAEELLVVKNMMKGDRNLEIILVDITQEIDRNIYKKTGQLPLSTDTLSSLKIELDDITGNRRFEIVCHGFTSTEEQSLDIFRYDERTLSISNIFSTVVDGSIELYSISDLSARGEFQRSQIIIHSNNTSTDDPLDIIKQVYQWQPSSQSFGIQFTEEITTESLLHDRLTDLYWGDNQDFKNYLQGAWFKTNTNSAQRIEILYFDTATQEFYYYDNEILELYSWARDRKLVYNKLYLESHNSLIDSLDCDVYIEAVDTETIYISVSGLVTDIPGQYKRIDIPLNQLLQTYTEEDFFIGRNFNGLYKGNLGFDIFFNLPYFSLITPSNNYQGVTFLYQIDEHWILELALPVNPDNKEETFNRHYLANFSIREEENHDIYTLTLQPIILRADQIIPTSDPMIRLEQITLKD